VNLDIFFQKLKGGSGSGHFGHSGIPGHHGGSAPSVSQNSVANGKKIAIQQFTQMRPNMQFEFDKKKDGRLQLIDVTGSKPKKTKTYILPDGNVVNMTRKKINTYIYRDSKGNVSQRAPRPNERNEYP